MQSIYKLGILGTIFAMLVLTSATAEAIDLTGTWEGKRTICKGLEQNGQTVEEVAYPANMYISQNGEDLDVSQGAFDHDGVVYVDASTNKGKGMIQKCLPDADPTRFVSFQIKEAETFAPDSKGVSGQMETILIYASKRPFGFFKECRPVLWERVSKQDPDVSGCNRRSVGGAVTRVQPRRVVCTNITTEQTLTIMQYRDETWDCETAGLIVQPGDEIRQTVTGPAD